MTERELAQAKWASSGLSDAHAEKLQFEVYTAAETASAGYERAASLRLPYFGFDGQPTGFYRLRYLEPLPGAAGAVAKPQRYTQPPGTLSEVYMPPLLDRSWEAVRQDPDVNLLITEGELKAACATAMGFPTMGLGGVDSWRASKKGIEFLDALERTVWKNRRAGIVYDSDAATNPNVVRAQNRLAKELSARGALVAIVSLPPGPEGAKQGLDDFLVAQGPEAFRALLKATPGLPESVALWEMNNEVVYIKDPGIIVVRDSGQRIAPGQFVSHAYANRHYAETKVTDDRVTLVTKPLAKRWVEWERRFEVGRLTYVPGEAQIHADAWNAWPGWGVAPVKGDLGPWHWMMDFLFKDETVSRKWFEQWCAYPMQHPGTKLYTTAVLWGLAKGTGKTAAAYALMKIYGRNAVEIKNKHLRGSFNSWAENKQFVYGDEITGGDTRVDADYVKGLITQHHMQVNVKFLPEYTIPDCINYLFSSNHPDAFFIEDMERRFFVHEVLGPPAEEARYRTFDKWLHGDGPSALFHYLLGVDLTGFNPKGHAPLTRASRAMALAGKSDIGMWCVRLREDPAHALGVFGPTAEVCDLYNASQLLRAYDPDQRSKVTAPGLGRELRRAGFLQVHMDLPVRTSLGLQRLWAVRNISEWAGAAPGKCAEHFDKHFGDKPRKY